MRYKLKQLREEKKMSAYRLSQLTGVSRSYILKIESGEATNVGMETLKKLAEGLGADPNDLISNDNL